MTIVRGRRGHSHDKMARATKLLELCKHITPKFTTLLKEAAGLVQQKTSTSNKKQKVAPSPPATSKASSSTDGMDLPSKKQIINVKNKGVTKTVKNVIQRAKFEI